MHRDDHGREWQGPFEFTLSSIEAQSSAMSRSGVYQVLYNGKVAYIGISASGDSIASRLRAHVTKRGNWGLGRIANPSGWQFVFFPCDMGTAMQIESHVTCMDKPPLNVKTEKKNFIPNITVH